MSPAAAHAAVCKARREGIIVPQPCERCGAKALAHHEDYSRALQITWLCPKHHAERHRELGWGFKTTFPTRERKTRKNAFLSVELIALANVVIARDRTLRNFSHYVETLLEADLHRKGYRVSDIEAHLEKKKS